MKLSLRASNAKIVEYVSLGFFFIIASCYLFFHGFSISGILILSAVLSIFALSGHFILRQNNILKELINYFSFRISFFQIIILFILGYCLTISVILVNNNLPKIHSLPLTILNAFGIILATTAVYLILGILNFAIGSCIYKRLNLQSDYYLVPMVIKIALGLVITMLYFYLVAFLQILNIGSLLLYGVIVVIIGWPYIFDSVRTLSKKSMMFSLSNAEQSNNPIILAAVLVLVILAAISVSGFTPIGGDDMRTYFLVPQTYVSNGGLTTFAFEPANNGLLGFSHLYTPVLLFFERAINYITIPVLLLTLSSIVALGSALFSKAVGRRAAYIFLLMPWTFWLLVLVKVDFLQVFFAIVSTLAIISAKNNNRMWLFIAGIFFSAAILVKFTAIILFPALLIFVLFVSSKRDKHTFILNPTLFCFGMLLVLLPWVVPNSIQWSNPIYPYNYKGSITTTIPITEANAYYSMKNFYDYAYDKIHLLSSDNSPWSNWFLASTGQSTYTLNDIGPFFLGLLPFAIVIGLRQRKKIIVIIAISVLATTFIWSLFIIRYVWYLMALFPLVIILYAYFLDRASLKWISKAVFSVLILIFLLQINTSRFEMVQYLNPKSTKEDYYSLFGSGYDLATYINNELRQKYPDFVIMPMGQHREILIEDSYRHLFSNYVLYTWVAITSMTSSANEARDMLTEAGITHVYWHNDDMQAFRAIWCADGDNKPSCLQFSDIEQRFHEMVRDLEIVQKTEDWSIYQL